MPITFDRGICCDLNETIKREWLVTNGLGGYAAGTVAGVLTRLQHGLLVAAPSGASTPYLLLAKIDEEVLFDERTYYLGTNEYRDGTLNPAGFVHLEAFRLEDGFPVFTYHLGGLNGIMLEKRIWMPYARNITCIQYRVLRTANDDGFIYKKTGLQSVSSALRHQHFMQTVPHALTLTLLPFSTYRPHASIAHNNGQRQFALQLHRTEDFINLDESRFKISLALTGCTLQVQDDTEDAFPYHILALAHRNSNATFLPTGIWYWNFLRRHEIDRGAAATDDLYLPGVLRATLWPDNDAALTLIVSAEALPSQLSQLAELSCSYPQAAERQRRLLSHAFQAERYFGEGGEAAHAHHLRILPLTTTPDPVAGGEEFLYQLLQSADRFLIQRLNPRTEHNNIDIYKSDHQLPSGKTERVPLLLSSYYQMVPSTRDMLIALPGLLLVTGRYDETLKLLRELARFFRGGLLPDQFPRPAHSGNGSGSTDTNTYNNADATLWFFSALDAYLRVSPNQVILEEFYHRLADCIDRYIQGTGNGIRLDPDDGLLFAAQPGKALTWMNASIDGTPITPRGGKAVEINGLWYHALSLMYEWSQQLEARGRRHRDPAFYERHLSRCRESFQRRFWYADGGYLYDVIDGPNGDDAALRPNQLFALALRHPVLDSTQHQRVLDVVTEHLLTPYGLRTLAPHDAAYQRRSDDTPQSYLKALHQGSAWTWLLEPYITALLHVHNQPAQHISQQDYALRQEYLWRKGLRLLEPIKSTFNEGLLGVTAGVFDGDPPHRPFHHSDYQASASATAALLRIYDMLARLRTTQPQHVLLR